MNEDSGSPMGKIPDGVRIYAIGDIHGRLDLLDQVLARIDAHLVGSPIHQPIQVFLGDYIDRGPASRSVLDRLIERGHDHESVFLKGNHEVIFNDFVENPLTLDEWRKYGGLDTLISYGLKPSAKISDKGQAKLATELDLALPPSHKQFLAGLKPYFICGDYFFVHAGVLPGVPLEQQQEDDLFWIRGEFLNYKESFGKIIVHGHTPVTQPEIHPNRINIDTGAYATGILTCLALEADKVAYI
jgi:serine/threonine protein phosphatase 1